MTLRTSDILLVLVAIIFPPAAAAILTGVSGASPQIADDIPYPWASSADTLLPTLSSSIDDPCETLQCSCDLLLNILLTVLGGGQYGAHSSYNAGMSDGGDMLTPSLSLSTSCLSLVTPSLNRSIQCLVS